MNGLCCHMCNQNSVVPEVRIIYKNRLLHKMESNIKAENYVLDNHLKEVIIADVYVCKRCGFEDKKRERLYKPFVLG